MKENNFCSNCPERVTCTIPCAKWMTWNETRTRMKEEGWEE